MNSKIFLKRRLKQLYLKEKIFNYGCKINGANPFYCWRNGIIIVLRSVKFMVLEN
jgi:hypothetical protein